MDSYLPLLVPPISDPLLERRKYLNALRGLLARRARVSAMDSLPITATIDLTTVCHLRCPMCSAGTGTLLRPGKVMADELVTKLESQLFDPLFVMYFYSVGEPLLNRSAARILRRAASHDIFGIVSTNVSIPLSDAQIDALLVSGLGLLAAAIDGATPESYSLYRRGGDFHLVLSNLDRLARRKAELGVVFPLLEWRFLAFEHNEHELELVETCAAQLGLDIVEFYPGFTPVEFPQLAPRVEDLSWLRPARSVRAATYCSALVETLCNGPASPEEDRPLQKLLRHREPLFREGRDSPSPGERKCDWLSLGTMVYSDGGVSPCCVLESSVDDFASIDDSPEFNATWNNDKFQRARNHFRDHPTDAAALGSTAGRIPCEACLLPVVQHLQMRRILQVVLRNAPAWALRILAADPDSFFFPIDRRLMPDELEPIYNREAELSDVTLAPGAARSMIAAEEFGKGVQLSL